MKRLYMICMAIILCFAMVACEKNAPTQDQGKENPPQKVTKVARGQGPRKMTTGKEMNISVDKEKLHSIHVKAKLSQGGEVVEKEFTGEEMDTLLHHLNGMSYCLALGDEDKDDWVYWVIFNYKDEEDPDIVVHELLFIDKMGQLDGINMIFSGIDLDTLKSLME